MVSRLSVIIPTRNRARLLEGTLASIVGQTLDKSLFEVIVADNGSTDSTAEVCTKFSGLLNLTRIHAPEPGLHVGRHAGLRAAASDILVYADDDIEALPTWLETIAEVFGRDPAIVLVGGKNLPKFEADPPFWLTERWMTPMDEGQVLYELSILDFGERERQIYPSFVFGCNFSIRKQTVIEAGGFHPDGMPFDLIRFRGDGESYISAFIEQQKLKAWYHPGASVRHVVTPERLTREYFHRRHFIQGVSDAYTHHRAGGHHQKNPAPYARQMTAAERWKARIRTLLGFEARDKLVQLRSSIDGFRDEVRAELSTDAFDRELARSRERGYRYLAHCYRTDPEVREWVHKESYM